LEQPKAFAIPCEAAVVALNTTSQTTGVTTSFCLGVQAKTDDRQPSRISFFILKSPEKIKDVLF
jgi:hypothetical protein